jgi:hypothetical protein
MSENTTDIPSLTLSTLPFDVRELIVSHLAVRLPSRRLERDEAAQKRRDLVAFGRTSKGWYELCEPLIWQVRPFLSSPPLLRGC